jgi:hypothetical protein
MDEKNACCSSESYCWSVRIGGKVVVCDCVLWFVSGVIVLLWWCCRLETKWWSDRWMT